MENYCNSCSSNHQELMNTWNKKGSLHPSNYDPFKGHTQPHKEGYSQPHEGKIMNKRHKEKFSCNPNNTYSSLDHTWIKQKPYSSN